MNEYIRPSYKFKEVNALSASLTLDDKIKISVEVIGEALKLSRHRAAVAFSGGKDSEVVADLIERFHPSEFQQVHCIFGNTGIEFPESLQFARKYGREHFGERFHETTLSELEEDELRYDFAKRLVEELEEEDALSEILKLDGKLKGQKTLIAAAKKRGYTLDNTNCFFKGKKKTFSYCIEQYGAPLLGKAASKLDAHRINIECFFEILRHADRKRQAERLLQHTRSMQIFSALLQAAQKGAVRTDASRAGR